LNGCKSVAVEGWFGVTYPICTHTNTSKATHTAYTILRQISTLVPREFVNDAAEDLKIKWRAFDPWSHLMTLVTVQLSRQESLNGICDIAKAIEYEWNRAGLELPRSNTLSNANMKRDPKMAENVFWKLLSLLELYGTAGAVILRMPRTKSLYFQPLLNFANAPMGQKGRKTP
jgi:hypothetical protein